MQIETFVLGDLQTNCYLLTSNAAGFENSAIIIDPADDGDFLNDELLHRGLKLQNIILTHGHFDHCLGLLSLKSAWGTPIMMNFADQFLLEKAQASAAHWLGTKSDPIPPADFDLAKTKNLDILGEEIEIIQTPGHTPGSICLLNKKEKFLFSGDTIFANGNIGRTDFAYSDGKKMSKSLEKLKELNQQGYYGQVYPGHGESYFL